MLSKGLRRFFSQNALRSILRSESQNETWAYGDVEKHSDAFSVGLQELGFEKGKQNKAKKEEIRQIPSKTPKKSKDIDKRTPNLSRALLPLFHHLRLNRS